MSAAHIPVLLTEAVDALAPQAGAIHVDATYGAGGYSKEILGRAGGRILAFDRDPDVVRRGASDPRIDLIEAPFNVMEDALAARGIAAVDGVIFDIGVSSMQLDEASRGFSFLRDGPLSMRMDQARPNAADVIASAEIDQLAEIFKAYGEEPRARRIARAIVTAREAAPIETTGRLAAIVAEAAPAAPYERAHPATQVFQALRIFVNDELGQLARGLMAAERLLKPGGRLVIVTFHSLEDRIVKRFFAERGGEIAGPSRHAPPRAAVAPTFRALTKKPIEAGAEELSRNPRARSAKLRAAARLGASANPSRAFAGAELSFSIDEWR